MILSVARSTTTRERIIPKNTDPKESTLSCYKIGSSIVTGKKPSSLTIVEEIVVASS